MNKFSCSTSKDSLEVPDLCIMLNLNLPLTPPPPKYIYFVLVNIEYVTSLHCPVGGAKYMHIYSFM